MGCNQSVVNNQIIENKQSVDDNPNREKIMTLYRGVNCIKERKQIYRTKQLGDLIQ